MGEPTPQQPVTPAGWYPDPAGTGQQRYFDGSSWTEHYAPAGGGAVPGPPPTKSNRGKIILGVGAAVVVLLVVAGLAGGGGDSGDDTAAPSTTVEPTAAPGTPAPAAPAPPITAEAPVAGGQITYEVQSDEPLSTVTYFDAINDLTQLADQPANWSTTFAGQATYQMHSLSAQTTGTQVSCRITVDGEVLVEESATGRYAVVTCAA